MEDRSATSARQRRLSFLREWMEPVRDLMAWPEALRQREVGGPPPPRPRRVALPVKELLDLLDDPDGEWAAKKETLRNVAWDAYDPDEQDRLAAALTDHPDPVVRERAGAALAAWSATADLLALTADPSSLVRKSAIYNLGLVPRDPVLAEPAWVYMSGAGGTTACEALRTYVAHATPTKARARLFDLALTDRREAVVTDAVSSLVDLGAAREVEQLLPLLERPPGVTWAVHVALLDGVLKLGLPSPPLDDLGAVDNLHLIRSVVALRCR